MTAFYFYYSVLFSVIFSSCSAMITTGKRATQGLVLAGAKTHQEKKHYNKNQQLASHIQEKGQLEKRYDQYMRAFSVCMDAKGYSVR